MTLFCKELQCVWYFYFLDLLLFSYITHTLFSFFFLTYRLIFKENLMSIKIKEKEDYRIFLRDIFTW